MSYGIQWVTDAGTLAITENSPGLSYVGQAYFSASVNQSTDYYRINCTNRPICFVELNDTTTAAHITDVSNVAAGIWQITVDNCSVATRMTQPPTKASPVIQCFASLTGPITPAGGFGLQVFNAAGVCTFDSGAPMIVPKQFIDLPSYNSSGGGEGIQTFSFGALTRPAMCSYYGSGSGSNRIYIAAGNQGTNFTRYRPIFWTNGGNVLSRGAMIISQSYQAMSTASPLSMYYSPETILFVDMANYT
jgi:hypothetical protein